MDDISKAKPTLYHSLILRCLVSCENITTNTIMSTNKYSKKQLDISKLLHVIIFEKKKETTMFFLHDHNIKMTTSDSKGDV